MFRYRLANLAIITTFMLSLLGALAAQPAHAQTGERCFTETKQCISGRFRQYWEANGGLAVFGFPLGPAQNERNRDTGQTYLTQWFERNRFELHPENKAPYDVLLGRLGDDVLRTLARDWKSEPKVAPKNGCLFFAETGHNVCDDRAGVGFRSYWQSHGLEFDGKAGRSYAESLALFGLPLTEPKLETNSTGDTVITQWFERARFERHPQETDPAYFVLLGLLGNELRGIYGAQPLPADVPWIHTGNYVAGARPGAVKALVAGPENGNPPWQVAASADGKLLAYVENNATRPTQLVVLNLQTGYQRAFAIDAGSTIFGMVFAPDGAQLAYSMIYDGPNGRYEVKLLDIASGKIAVRTAANTTQAVPVVTTWDANGLYARLIYYQSDAPLQGWVQIDPQTGAVKTLVSGANLGAATSPNGRSIAVITGEKPILDTPKAQIAVRDRTTGKENVIVPMGAYSYGELQWSADSGKLAYARYVQNGNGAESLRIINADGTGEQALRLDTGAFPGILLDYAFRGNTLLVLTVDGPSKLSLFEVPLSNFHPAQAKLLQSFDENGGRGGAIVYVPR
jgi:hypothetical protein